MKTGLIIKKILKDKGLKQKWLAQQLNISPARLSLMLDREISFDDAVKICNILGIPINELEQKKEDSAIPPRTTESSQTEI